MRRVPVLLLLLVLTVPAARGPWAQEDDDLETRQFTVRFKAVEDAIMVVRPLLGEDGAVTMHPRRRIITVLDEPDNLRVMALALREFDVPPRHVNVAIQLIMGIRGPAEEEDKPPAQPLPGIDGSLRDTLLSTTRWDQYHLLGSASFTASEGEESSLMLGEDYRIRFAVDEVNEQRAVTRFDSFALERGRAGAGGQVDFTPIWDVVLNLRDNQLYVFGATRLADSRKAIFLSITAGIVD